MVQPTGSRLFVEAVELNKETTTKSGLIVAAGWNVAPESVQGKVLAVGPDAKVAKVGDIVLVPQFAPTQAKEAPGDKTYIIPEEDVLAFITPN
jgi:co-chaperonin GroES (HSP10)